MSTQTVSAASPAPVSRIPAPFSGILRSLQAGLITCLAMAALGLLIRFIITPALAAVQVDEHFTTEVSNLLIGLIPVAFCIAAGAGARPERKKSFIVGWIMVALLVVVFYGGYIAYQSATGGGAYQQVPTLGFTFQQADAGIEVLAVEPGSPSEEAGILPGDMILALRRDVITADELRSRLSEASLDDAFRLRIQRGSEEVQLTTQVGLVAQIDTSSILRGLLSALVLMTVAYTLPSKWMPHLLLILALLPLLAGYFWLIIATFSDRTHGLLPVDTNGQLGGFTLSNWRFLSGEAILGPTVNIWSVTFNSLAIAVSMTVVSIVICSMAGYALSRMSFRGRRTFLSMTLLLHGFPAVTLIIPIFLVLINLGSLPIIGSFIGYNKPGGVALVMIAFELPLGIWLIKGFFDNISWDMERSALIDGASRWRTFWEIILPQIRPGLLALGIFSFIGGWNSYLIPATYTVGTGLANLPVYIRQLSGEIAPVNWNQVAAVGLFQLIPILIFFIFAQEYLLNIYAGGTKGSS
jgi:inositol-phosphate transport system permease protein